MQFSFGSIPVRIQPFFLVLILLIGWLSTQSLPLTMVWAVVIFFSVLIHELGHALTAKSFGQSVMIELFGMGGVTYRNGPPLKKWQDFVIVFNGPLAGFCLGVVAYFIVRIVGAEPPNLLTYTLIVAFNVNIFWTIINLLPVHPLDGGHLLRILLEGLLGFRGTQAALLLSTLAGLGLSIFFFTTAFWIAGALFFMFTFESFRKFQSTLQLSSDDQNQELQDLFKEAEISRQSGDDEQALSQYLELREKTARGVLYLAATESAASLMAQMGRFQQAYELLQSISNQLSGQAMALLHQLAYQLGEWKEAIRLGNRLFQQQPDYQTAVLNSLCHATLGETEPAIGWLQAAIDEGLPNLVEISQKREYDTIRDHAAFQKIINSHSS